MFLILGRFLVSHHINILGVGFFADFVYQVEEVYLSSSFAEFLVMNRC